MGAFYGSIHVRTSDIELVKASLVKLHERTKSRFLLGPCIRGWIGIFPNGHGSDLTVSEFLAKELSAPVLHCIVHDDDVFAYRLYHIGNLIDEYSSNPACFDESIEPGRPPSGGKVELFEELLPFSGQAEKLRELLKAPHADFIFEQERMSRFAELIALPNACTSYEYLQDGERDGITRWREFVHVPDLSAEKTAKRAAAARVRSELKALHRDKVLVRELKEAFWCIDPATSELLLSERGVIFGQRKPLRLLTLAKPWTGELRDTGVEMPGTAFHVTVSSSGRWMGIGNGYGRWTAELWDRHTNTGVLELPHHSAVSDIFFSPGEEFLFTRSQNEIFVTSVKEARNILTFDAGNYGNAVALHPQTQHLIADARDYWRATRVDKPGVIQNLRRTPTNFQSVSSDFFIAKMQYAQLLADEKQLEQAGRDKVEKECREWQAVGTALNEFSGQVFALRFTADGKFLLCATSEGLLVFAAAEIAAAHDRLPRAQFTFGLQREFPGDFSGVTGSPYIYSFTEDERQSRILFGGIQGAIYFLSLADGSSGELFRPPEANRLFRITLTPDRSALICGALPALEKKTGQPKTQIWNYEALCRIRGLAH